jgi:hypothetical protein
MATLAELKAKYYDALQAEDEAWKAYQIAVDAWHSPEHLEAMRQGAEMFSAEKSAAYTEWQNALHAELFPDWIDDCTCTPLDAMACPACRQRIEENQHHQASVFMGDLVENYA